MDDVHFERGGSEVNMRRRLRNYVPFVKVRDGETFEIEVANRLVVEGTPPQPKEAES